MKYHELKTDPAVFAAVAAGDKTHEIRFNDRDFQIGDVLHLRETVATGEAMRAGAPLEYTGRQAMREVSHIQTGYGLVDGWVILSFNQAVPTKGRRREDNLPGTPLDWGTPDALHPEYRTNTAGTTMGTEMQKARSPVDYHLLLAKYIDHVSQEEGTTFIGRITTGEDFTEQEVQTLRELDAKPQMWWKQASAAPDLAKVGDAMMTLDADRARRLQERGPDRRVESLAVPVERRVGGERRK